jgi:alkylation response protein AidB-like acyl-CoA dehydrogenase
MVDRTILTRSAEVPGGFELNGLKRFVRPGPAADGFIVSARTDAGTIGLYWVPRESTGVELGVGRLADGSLVADVTLRKVHVAAESVVWSSSTPGCPLTAALDEALILTSAELLGVAGHTLAITLEHLRFRKQFGKPIGSFQALQHRAVNAHIQLQLAGAALESAIRAHRAEDPLARSLAASRVKGRCSETALAIGREAVQMHGAVGVTEEYDVGLYLKRALVQSAWLGNASQHRRRYAGLGAGRGSGDA